MFTKPYRNYVASEETTRVKAVMISREEFEKH